MKSTNKDNIIETIEEYVGSITDTPCNYMVSFKSRY